MSNSDASHRWKLPARYATIVMPLILSLMMTFIVSLIATAKNIGFSHPELGARWMSAWALSWMIAFPVLLIVLPIVRRIVACICHPH